MSAAAIAPAAPMNAAERAATLRDLLAAADGCRILLTERERAVVLDAIALYDPEGA